MPLQGLHSHRLSFYIYLNILFLAIYPILIMTFCFVCQQMADRNSAKHGGLLSRTESKTTEHCLLCNRDFCKAHKSRDSNQQICEIKHETYYYKHRNIPNIFPSLEALEREKSLIRQAEDSDRERELVTV